MSRDPAPLQPGPTRADAPGAAAALRRQEQRRAERQAARRAARQDTRDDRRAAARADAAQAAAALAAFGPADPARRLDFIVTGVARSGTTAVADYLSAVPGVFCGPELFEVAADHRALHPPHCFAEAEQRAAADPHLCRIPKFRRATAAIAAADPPVTLFGNKQPYYLCRLAAVLGQIGRPRAIVCTRDILPVAQSHVLRALNPDDNFGAGRTGVYALGDWLALVHALAAVPGDRVLVMPYRAIAADWRRAIADALAFIDPAAPVSFDARQVRQIEKRYLRKKDRRAAQGLTLPEYERAAIAAFAGCGAERLLDADRPFPLAAVQPDLRAIAARLPDPVDHVVGLLEHHPLQLTVDYLGIWLDQMRLRPATALSPSS
jgi:hypothetical protein